MTGQREHATPTSYQNPLFGRDFPDPFVLKYRGEYWAYCTGFWDDGRCFGILHSRDLVQWQPAGGAMEPLPGNHTCYWAPEVTYDNGRFYLYYSVGNEEQMQIRVALAGDPAGPFVDSGQRLTAEPFAIDPHVFMDQSGARFLFYATDFLDHERVGTGTVRDRMVDRFTLLGQPRPVTRARFDWQIYDPHRIEKGGVRWHTIEGPFVLQHKGLYYQMFSGGNWRDPSYGVCYATTENLDRTEEWDQACDGLALAPILQTIPDQVIGPGHNSVVRGPDNRQLYCVYHRWEGKRTGRLLAIDPLEWSGERLLVLGPSQTPQPAPPQPTFVDFFDQADGLGEGWEVHGGRWRTGEGEARQTGEEAAEALCRLPAAAFVVELSLRAITRAAGSHAGNVAFGLALRDEDDVLLRCQLFPARNEAAIVWRSGAGWRLQAFALPVGFDSSAYHLFRLEVDGSQVHLSLDEHVVRWAGHVVDSPTYQVSLCTDGLPAAFSGFGLTSGWQDWFVDNGAPADAGWQADEGLANWRLENGRLLHQVGQGADRLHRGPLLPAYEAIFNAARVDEDALYGFFPALTADGSGPLLAVAREEEQSALYWREGGETTRFALPARFDPALMQQFRFRVEPGRLAVQWQDQLIGEGSLSPGPARVGLYAQGHVAFDLVRVTATAG